MRAFWWRPRASWRNFGDELSPILLARFAGIDPQWSPATEARVVAVGSIATMLPRQYAGAILGIGTARASPLDFSRADVRALRGPLTARIAGVTHPVAFGDPGLLASELIERPDSTYAIGVVAHWQDRTLPEMYPDALVIDVRANPRTVIRQIASCERIVSSSLHGLVVADAFGLPRQWAWFERVQGHGMKFADYGLSVGAEPSPGVWATADRKRVDRARADLREAYATWGALQ